MMLRKLEIAKFLNKLSNKCPATILADSRIDNVKGRIIFLTNSIRTIKFIKIIGVPVGTVWAIMFFVFLIHPYNIKLIQNATLVGNDNIIWAVGVKTNGIRAIILLIIMNINTPNIDILIPFFMLSFKRGLISFRICDIKILMKTFHLKFIFILLLKNKVSGRIIFIHKREKFEDDGSNIENRLFIIFS